MTIEITGILNCRRHADGTVTATHTGGDVIGFSDSFLKDAEPTLVQFDGQRITICGNVYRVIDTVGDPVRTYIAQLEKRAPDAAEH